MDSAVSNAPAFDRLATVYSHLERLAFGGSMRRARRAHLDRLRGRERILLIGDGPGSFVADCAPALTHARVDSVDASVAMIQRARRRLARVSEEALRRVRWIHGDARRLEFGGNTYDAIVTQFFFDMFSVREQFELVQRLTRSARERAVWLEADFQLPPGGWTRWRARIWLKVMYAFFGAATGLRARSLCDASDALRGQGWNPSDAFSTQHGFIRSICWSLQGRSV